MTGLVDGAADAGAEARPDAPARERDAKRRTGLRRGDASRGRFDQRRWFILLPFALTAGVVAGLTLPVDVPWPWLAVGGVGLAVTVVLNWPSRAVLWTSAMIAAVLLGLALVPIHGTLFGTVMLARPVFGTLSARVDEIISRTDAESRVIVSQLRWEGDALTPGLRRARLLVKGGPVLQPGDQISGKVRLAPVPGPAYPGGYDGQMQSYFDGVGAWGNATEAVRVTPGPGAGADRLIESVREAIAARIDAVVPAPAAGVARAIITGDQSAVDHSTRDMMATAGIAHVLSVSGLHLTIVAGGVFALLRLALAGFVGLGRFVATKTLAALGGMAAALGYYAISGGNVAALRSTLMILLVFGAVLAGRRSLTMRNVAWAGLLVVLGDPASVLRPSFQLSFAAVIGLVGAYELPRRERGEVGWVGRAVGYVTGIVVTSVVAGIATLPFSVVHFQQTSPLGVLGNLATLPLVGFVIMPAAALAVVLMPLGLATPCLVVLGWAIDRMLDMATVVAGWSLSLRASPLLSPMALLIAFGALGVYAVVPSRLRFVGPVLAVPLVLAFGMDSRPDVLVADTTRTVAVRETNGLALAAGKDKSFVLDVWRETWSEPIAGAAAMSCDSLACVGRAAAGFGFAIVTEPDAFAEECDSADLVVTRLYAPGWCHPRGLVDAAALAAGGVHWLRWDPARQDFEVRTSVGGADRAWRPAAD